MRTSAAAACLAGWLAGRWGPGGVPPPHGMYGGEAPWAWQLPPVQARRKRGGLNALKGTGTFINHLCILF